MQSDEIIKVVDELGKRFGLAIDWSQANLLPQLQMLGEKMVKYELYKSVFYCLLSIVVLIASFIAAKKLWYLDDDYEFSKIIGGISLCFVVLIFSVSLIDNVENLIKCIFLPEAVVLQYFKGIKP